jgi:hypothetical protein
MEIPSDRAVLDQLERMVSKFRARPHVEMEVRFGHKAPDGKFLVGVTYDYSKALYCAMTDELSVKQWSKIHERSFTYKYFEGSVRGCFAIGLTTTYHQINNLEDLDVFCPVRQHHLRFSLKEEVPLTKFVSHKPATSVRCSTRSTIEDNAWIYDFTKTVQGKTTEEACRSAYVITIELELNRDEHYLNQKSDREIAINFLGKARDILGRFNSMGNEESLHMEVVRGF